MSKVISKISHWRVIAVLLGAYDIVASFLAYGLALLFRFDFRFSQIPDTYLHNYLCFLPVSSVIVLVFFAVFRMYRSLWRYASFHEVLLAIGASLCSGLIHALGITVIFGSMPISYYVLGPICQMVLTMGIRFSYRFVLLERARIKGGSGQEANVMIIGAGTAGQMLQRECARMDTLKVVCFIDDNQNKWNRYIDGTPVYGGREKILEAVDKFGVEKILVAIPSASQKDRREIINICNASQCEVKTIPGTVAVLRGEVTYGSLAKVSMEDLLGRGVIKVDNSEIFRQLRDKVILITGGGGSIGSELARQIAVQGPKKLIILDIYENNAYSIRNELLKKYPGLKLEVLIGSVRDSRRLDDIFRTYRPEIVFHAAAHKHVPLMEDSPQEAIKNNTIGTYKTAYAAIRYGVKHFVLISTDKAVNPTNIMGASKRLCEMVIQTMSAMVRAGRADELPNLFSHEEFSSHEPLPKDAVTEFSAVRFGNVLGSNGSVVPLFKQQIAEGGPVTVTHPDIIRYFMTIPEAVSLVLQASVYANGGRIFVLDMGEPVKIDTLARNLIHLSGLKPDVDIKIEYTGLRPGEKLYEEKLMEEEGLQKTPNDLIFIGNPIPFDKEKFLEELKEVYKLAFTDEAKLREKVIEIALRKA